MNSAHLWKKRFFERMKEIARYARYMFNDHLLIVLLIAIGGGGYYYQDWVKGLTPDFPTALLFAVLFSILLTVGNVITFLKEPDMVYLLPVENRLKTYIVYGAIYSYVLHIFILGLASLFVAPIYNQTVLSVPFVGFLLFLFALKGLNLWVKWVVDYDRDNGTVVADWVLRALLNGSLVYLFIENSSYLFAVFLIFAFYVVYFWMGIKGKGLPWERLIDNEKQRMGRFYRIANLFTDVPHLQNEVKRRKALDVLIKGIPFQTKETYMFLYSRAFLRSGDYFGMFLRLTIIGGLLLWWLEGFYFALFATLLFLYLTGYQLLSLWKHFEAVLWTQVYPIGQGIKNQTFLRLLTFILLAEHFLFSVVYILSGETWNGLILFVSGIIFIYGFVYGFSKKRIEHWEEEAL